MDRTETLDAVVMQSDEKPAAGDGKLYRVHCRPGRTGVLRA